MGLLSIFKRKNEAAAVVEPADEVHRARTRARQRLIGAVVLLAIGIVGFPLVFETQPRPIPVDIPIEIPHKDGAPPLTIPTARAPAPIGAAPAVVASNDSDTSTPGTAPPKPLAGTPNDEVITESREDAGRDVPAPRASDAPASRAATKPAAIPPKPSEAKPSAEPKPSAEAKPDAKPTGDDGARARALLDGKQTGKQPDAAGRFVVQVGAFADAAAAHDTRLKIEKLGLKTYTQVASTSAGNRIRVRVGPFASRDEADKAMAKARGAGLSAVVLTL